MATIDLIDSTGDKGLSVSHQKESSFSRAIAKELVAEILENALERVESAEKRPVGDIIEGKMCTKASTSKNKLKKIEELACPLKGIGDQVTNQEVLTPEKKYRHPPVEKKNRLTDLVKNSKQLLARYIQSKTDMAADGTLKEEKFGKDEKLVNVIELDCVNANDIPFRSKTRVLPENVPLPRDDSNEIVRNPEDEKMEEIRLGMTVSEPGPSKEDICKKTMTFPLSHGTNKMTFAAKCKTLRINAGDFKKKKWNLGTKIANFLKKRQTKNTADKKNTEKNEENEKDLMGSKQ